MSDFDKEFSQLRELSTFKLRGSNIIVEIQPREEMRTKGGLHIVTDAQHTKGGSINAHMVDVGVVLMTGPGYWTEQEQNMTGTALKGFYEALEVQPGAVVIMPQHSAQLLSHFPGITRPTNNKLAMIKMDNVAGYYPSQEAYEQTKKKLNE